MTKRIITVVLGITLCIRIFDVIATAPTVVKHPDESNWIHSSYFFGLLIERDFSNPDWSNFIWYDHPPIGKYIFGAALHVNSQRAVTRSDGLLQWHRGVIAHRMIPALQERLADSDVDISPRYQSLHDYCFKMYAQTEPKDSQRISVKPLTDRDYAVCRYTSCGFAILATLMLIAVCYCATGGMLAGMIAGLVFLTNQATIPTFQQALVDSICCFFVLASVLVAMWLFRVMNSAQGRSWRIIAISALEGLLLGLAIGTKFVTAPIPIAVAGVFFLSVCLQISRRRESGERSTLPMGTLLTSLIVIIATAMAVFVVTNPYLMTSPISHTFDMLAHRRSVMEVQALFSNVSITSPTKRLVAIFKFGILMGYDVRRWALPCAVFIGCLYMGTLRLAYSFRGDVVRHNTCIGLSAIILAWIAATFFVNGLAMNMLVHRYFVPFVACTSVVFAIGADYLVDIFLFSKRVRSP